MKSLVCFPILFIHILTIDASDSITAVAAAAAAPGGGGGATPTMFIRLS